MPKCATTDISIGQSYQQIRKLLLDHGARKICPVEDIDEQQVVQSVRLGFELPSQTGKLVPFVVDVPIIYRPKATAS